MSLVVNPVHATVPTYNNKKYFYSALRKAKDKNKNVSDKVEKEFKLDHTKVVDILV